MIRGPKSQSWAGALDENRSLFFFWRRKKLENLSKTHLFASASLYFVALSRQIKCASGSVEFRSHKRTTELVENLMNPFKILRSSQQLRLIERVLGGPGAHARQIDAMTTRFFIPNNLKLVCKRQIRTVAFAWHRIQRTKVLHSDHMPEKKISHSVNNGRFPKHFKPLNVMRTRSPNKIADSADISKEPFVLTIPTIFRRDILHFSSFTVATESWVPRAEIRQ